MYPDPIFQEVLRVDVELEGGTADIIPLIDVVTVSFASKTPVAFDITGPLEKYFALFITLIPVLNANEFPEGPVKVLPATFPVYV